MAEPTGRIRLIPQNTAVAAIDTPAERLAAIVGQSIISTGIGNEANFGTLDISGGAVNSGVLTLLWDIIADGGFTVVDTFKQWLSSNGFDIAGTVAKVQPLCGDDGTPVNTEKYIADGVVGSYTWATMDESEPGAQNVWPTDEGTNMALSTTSDDVVLFAVYLAIAAGETPGIYKGTDADYQLQFSFKFAYS